MTDDIMTPGDNVYRLWETIVRTHPAANSNGLRSDIGLAVIMFPPIVYNVRNTKKHVTLFK